MHSDFYSGTALPVFLNPSYTISIEFLQKWEEDIVIYVIVVYSIIPAQPTRAPAAPEG